MRRFDSDLRIHFDMQNHDIILHMKTCTNCKKHKRDSSFHKKRMGLQATCKSCDSTLSREWYKKNRSRVIEAVGKRKKLLFLDNQKQLWDYKLTHPCVDCGEKNPIVLDCDHKNRKTKVAAITQMIFKGLSWKVIELELQKCDIRCANCHRIR